MATTNELLLSDAVADIRKASRWVESMTPENAGSRVVSTRLLLEVVADRLEALRDDLERARTPVPICSLITAETGKRLDEPVSDEPVTKWETV